jgi:hypothetical protein
MVSGIFAGTTRRAERPRVGGELDRRPLPRVTRSGVSWAFRAARQPLMPDQSRADRDTA